MSAKVQMQTLAVLRQMSLLQLNTLQQLQTATDHKLNEYSVCARCHDVRALNVASSLVIVRMLIDFTTEGAVAT